MSPAAFTVQTNATTSGPLFGNIAESGFIGATATAAHGFYYELLYNTAFTGSQAPSPNYGALFVGGGIWLDSGLTATNTVSSTGKASPMPANTGATVPWANGTTNNIVIVGWSADLGTSWGAASNNLANWATSPILGQNSFFGVSTTGYINPFTGNPGAVAIGTAASVSGLPIFSLNTQLYLLPTTPIPEPTTMVLAGLGGLSLLLFRRRK